MAINNITPVISERLARGYQIVPQPTLCQSCLIDIIMIMIGPYMGKGEPISINQALEFLLEKSSNTLLDMGIELITFFPVVALAITDQKKKRSENDVPK